MNNTIKEEYERLHRQEKLILTMSAAVVILFLIIKFDENVPLWLMIAAVILALMDGLFVIGYHHNKEELAKRLKERKEQDGSSS